MPFTKGNTFGQGRPKGSENKGSKEFKDALDAFMIEAIKDVPELYSQLDAKEKLDYLAKLSPYITPRITEKHLIDESEIPEQPLFIENTMVVSNEKYKEMKEGGRIDQFGNLIDEEDLISE